MSKKSFISYALLGSGRLARHLSFYLQHLKLPVFQWSRNGDPAFNSFQIDDPKERLNKVLQESSHILLAVKDEAIEQLLPFMSEHHVATHFSGALSLPNATAAHPLMTFGPGLQDPDWYRSIPFILDQGTDLKEILPGLPNLSFKLSPERRSYYHALCSLAGNSVFLLWSRVHEVFEQELELPSEVLGPYLHQVVTNSGKSEKQAFTGPVARGDWSIVKGHLQSLKHRPDLANAYRAYLQMARAQGIDIPGDLL